MEDDGCMANVNVSEKYGFAEPLGSIPVLMMDYENVAIARVVNAGSTLPTYHVTRLSSGGNAQCKTAVLHPLEAEIQKDFELKQKQCVSPQKSHITLSTLQEFVLGGILRTPADFSLVQGRYTDSETVIINKEIHLQHVPSCKKMEHGKLDLPNQQDMCGVNQEMVVHGQLVNINGDGRENEKNEVFESSNNDKKNNVSAISKRCEFPLKVEAVFGPDNQKSDVDASTVNRDSDSEDEGDDNVEPVCDYEPDPELTRLEKEDNVRKPNKCYMCFKSFRQKKNMYAHMRKIHSIQPKIEGGILCPLCKMHALWQEHLRNHLEMLHNLKIEKEEKLFNTMDEFLLWKGSIERETQSLYISKSSAKLLANNQQKIYFKCHRSGTFVSFGWDNRKRRFRTHGSNKIGATCPAAMEVTENVNGVNVIFWKTHVGHDNDLSHVTPSYGSKTRAKECLKSGVPWAKVRDNVTKMAGDVPSVSACPNTVPEKASRDMNKTSDARPCREVYPICSLTKVYQGRKPMKERILRRASQSLLIEKANLLSNLLKTTEVVAELRPRVCLMIDNVISTIRRSAVKDVGKRGKNDKKEDSAC